MLSRRRPLFLAAGCLILHAILLWPSLSLADDAAAPLSLEQLRQARHEAAHRPRRIIFNNDGDEPVYCCSEATPQAVLKARTSRLVGTQVDAIYYCTWSSGFGMFTHNTKIGEIFTCKANPKAKDNPNGGFSRNITAELIARGTDPLKIMVHWCKTHHTEVFWSFRMNDTHDAWSSWYTPYMFPKLKQEHPDWLVSSKEHKAKCGGWTAVDYGRPEIRELAFRFTEEVCQNYAIDGVELDFFRHPVCFKRHAMGEDAGQEECDQMTNLVRRIRQMTEQEGLKRGCPILVSVRVPDSVEYCRAMGLDIARWLEEGLIDRMAVSDYFRLNPWEVSVELGHRYGVPVYACLSESRLTDDEVRKIRFSVECYRGRATEAWAAGVDGIYMFNAFNPASPLWKELGAPAGLKTKDKIYTTGARGVDVIKVWMNNGERFLNRKVVSPERPVALQPDQPATVELRVGQELTEGAPSVKLGLRIGDAAKIGGLAVHLNDQPLASGVKSGRWAEFPVDPSLVKQGANRIAITLSNESEAMKIDDLVLWVRYPKGS